MKGFLNKLPLIIGLLVIIGSLIYGIKNISDANDKYFSLREKFPDHITIKYMTEDRGCYVTDLEPDEDYISEFLDYQRNSPCTLASFYTNGFGIWFLYIFSYILFLNFFYIRFVNNSTNLDVQKKYLYTYYFTFITVILLHTFLLSAFALVLMSMGGGASDYILYGAIKFEFIVLPLVLILFLLNNFGQHSYHKKKLILLSLILMIPAIFIALVYF